LAPFLLSWKSKNCTMGHPEPAITHRQNLRLLPACSILELTWFYQVKLQPCQVSTKHHLLWREPHSSGPAGGQIVLLLDKTGGQINTGGGKVSPPPGGGWAECWADPSWGVGLWPSPSLVKMTPHLTTLKKLLMNWNWQTSKRKVFD
jgi:hypothetical protein